MTKLKHVAVYISNKQNKKSLIEGILSNQFFSDSFDKNYALFSDITLNKFIDEERRHGQFDVETKTKNSLRNSSQGERRKALLQHIISKKPKCIIVDNAFDSLDVQAQSDIKKSLEALSAETIIIQISNRKRDVLSFIETVFKIENGTLVVINNLETPKTFKNFVLDLPQDYKQLKNKFSVLIHLRDVTLSYGKRCILKHINWEIKPGEFWQLIGPNGSGKSTILNLISGDNPKGFMQDMTLFDMKKGSGESVWDIKKHIGFFSSDMLIGFKRKDSIENMIVSGFLDSIGLYKIPNERQIQIAHQWLRLLNMFDIKDKNFNLLSDGHKRLVLIARAMVKQPPLLILDEPINGLDDFDAEMFSELINKIAKESNTAILYVSHREEKNIKPHFVFKLTSSKAGSTGSVIVKK
ncbi:hypothetical protein GCM10022291_02600 [Postechiella marina]|uniref:ABC transporter domain-containing protein n=1 Tax=Postechiella marina TaxID=943941 RepID=A0ABP8C052_9FLAO